MGDGSARGRLVHREWMVLLSLCVLSVLAFLVTRAAAAAEHRWRLRDAERWYQTGQSAVERRAFPAAVEAFARAAALDRGTVRYQMSLADALAGDGEIARSVQVLSGLRRQMPEAADVNLQLARLEAGRGHVEPAVRYYLRALHGVWPDEPGNARREARIELIRYLLQQRLQARALSELLVLSANLPDDAAAQLIVGELYLRADEPRRAADVLARGVSRNPEDGRMRARLGEALFQSGEYARARRELALAPDHLDDVARLRAICDFVLTRDPLISRLSLRERQRRLGLALAYGRKRLETCRSAAGRQTVDVGRLEGLRQEVVMLEPEVARVQALRDAPAVAELVVALTARIERAVEGCVPAAPLGAALLLIAGRHGLEQ
jgi:tetratricopeptide (TPR) repeat protein